MQDVNKKRNLSLGLLPTWLGAFTSPYTQQAVANPLVPSPSWFRNINLIPFRCNNLPKRGFYNELPYTLGPTNPCPITVHTEPCSTSVLKALTSIFATNTKICTRACSSLPHSITPSSQSSTPSYSFKITQYPERSCIGIPLKRHPFSGLIHSAGRLLHDS